MGSRGTIKYTCSSILILAVIAIFASNHQCEAARSLLQNLPQGTFVPFDEPKTLDQDVAVTVDGPIVTSNSDNTITAVSVDHDSLITVNPDNTIMVLNPQDTVRLDGWTLTANPDITITSGRVIAGGGGL